MMSTASCPRPTAPHVSAVMPCLNEERTLGVCIDKAFASFAALGVEGEVIVADNGSTDGSVALATSHGARVVTEPIKGYGAALRRGITESRGEIIVIGDADDSYDWAEIAPFVRKIEEGHDLVMGNRFKGANIPGAMPLLHRYVGNPALSAISRVAFRIGISDFHCGMRAFTRSAFERMQTRTHGMEFATEMIANARYQGLRITEIPTTLYPDKRDRAPHLRSFRDGWRHLRFILTHAPDHLFLLPGLGMLSAGLLLLLVLSGGPVSIADHYFGIHFVALGAMLTLAGFNVFNLGVFAKTLMANRYSGLRSRTVMWLRQRYSLETALIFGTGLVTAGLILFAAILLVWLRQTGQSMNQTVHLAFVAGTLIVLGLNIVFSAFLLNLILSQERSEGI